MEQNRVQEKYQKVREEILNDRKEIQEMWKDIRANQKHGWEWKNLVGRVDSYVFHNITKKLHYLKEDRLESRFMLHVVNSLKSNKIVNITGYNAISMPFSSRVGRYLENDIFGEQIISLVLRFHGNVPIKHLESMVGELRAIVSSGSKGLIILVNAQDNTLIRELLRYIGEFHALVASEKPVVEGLVNKRIHIGGKGKGLQLVTRALRKIVIREENGWEGYRPKPYYWATIYKLSNFKPWA